MVERSARLRKQEGFRGSPVGTEVGDVRHRVESVHPAAAEDKPPAVAAPRVVALDIRAVYLVHRAIFSRLRREEEEVGVFVPDAEVAVRADRKHQMLSVRGDAGERCAALFRLGVEERIHLIAERMRRGVEGDTAEAISHLPELLAGQCRGRAEVERPSVGREGGEGLHPLGRAEEGRGRDGVLLGVVHHDVRCRVIDLDAVRVARMESLERAVHAESHVAAVAIPAGIDEGGEGMVGLRVELLDFVATDEVSPGVLLAHVEEHRAGIAVAEGMAVHAVVVRLAVLDDGGLRERGQVALVNAHRAPVLVAGRDEAVGQVRVNLLVGDVERERGVLDPLPVFAGEHLDGNVLPLGVGQQFMPSLELRAEAVVRQPGSNRFPVGGVARFTVGSVRQRAEGERGDVGGNGRVGVIGEDAGLFRFLDVGRNVVPARGEHEDYQE